MGVTDLFSISFDFEKSQKSLKDFLNTANDLLNRNISSLGVGFRNLFKEQINVLNKDLKELQRKERENIRLFEKEIKGLSDTFKALNKGIEKSGREQAKVIADSYKQYINELERLRRARDVRSLEISAARSRLQSELEHINKVRVAYETLGDFIDRANEGISNSLIKGFSRGFTFISRSYRDLLFDISNIDVFRDALGRISKVVFSEFRRNLEEAFSVFEVSDKRIKQIQAMSTIGGGISDLLRGIKVDNLLYNDVVSNLIELSNKYGLSLRKVVENLYLIVEGGLEYRDALKLLEPAIQGSIASNSSLTDIIKGLQKVTFSYGSEAKNYADILDYSTKVLNMFLVAAARGSLNVGDFSKYLSNVVPMGKQLGATLEENIALLSALSKVLRNAPEAQVSLVNIYTKLLNPIERGKNAIMLINEYLDSINRKDLKIFLGKTGVSELGSVLNVLMQIDRVSKELGTRGGFITEQEKFLNSIFNEIRASRGFYALLGNLDVVKKEMEFLRKESNFLNESFNRMTDSVDFRLDALRSRVVNTLSGIYFANRGVILGLIDEVGFFIEGLLKRVVVFSNNLFDSDSGTYKLFREYILSLSELFNEVKVSISLVINIFNSLFGVGGSVDSSLPIQDRFIGVLTNLNRLLVLFGKFINNVLEGILNLSPVIGVITQLFLGFFDVLGRIPSSIYSVVISLGVLLSSFLSIKVAVGVIGSLSAVFGGLPVVISGVVLAIGGLVSVLGLLISKFDVFGSKVNEIEGALGRIKSGMDLRKSVMNLDRWYRDRIRLTEELISKENDLEKQRELNNELLGLRRRYDIFRKGADARGILLGGVGVSGLTDWTKIREDIRMMPGKDREVVRKGVLDALRLGVKKGRGGGVRGVSVTHDYINEIEDLYREFIGITNELFDSGLISIEERIRRLKVSSLFKQVAFEILKSGKVISGGFRVLRDELEKSVTDVNVSAVNLSNLVRSRVIKLGGRDLERVSSKWVQEDISRRIALAGAAFSKEYAEFKLGQLRSRRDVLSIRGEEEGRFTNIGLVRSFFDDGKSGKVIDDSLRSKRELLKRLSELERGYDDKIFSNKRELVEKEKREIFSIKSKIIEDIYNLEVNRLEKNLQLEIKLRNSQFISGKLTQEGYNREINRLNEENLKSRVELLKRYSGLLSSGFLSNIYNNLSNEKLRIGEVSFRGALDVLSKEYEDSVLKIEERNRLEFLSEVERKKELLLLEKSFLEKRKALIESYRDSLGVNVYQDEVRNLIKAEDDLRRRFIENNIELEAERINIQRDVLDRLLENEYEFLFRREELLKRGLELYKGDISGLTNFIDRYYDSFSKSASDLVTRGLDVIFNAFDRLTSERVSLLDTLKVNDSIDAFTELSNKLKEIGKDLEKFHRVSSDAAKENIKEFAKLGIGIALNVHKINQAKKEMSDLEKAGKLTESAKSKLSGVITVTAAALTGQIELVIAKGVELLVEGIFDELNRAIKYSSGRIEDLFITIQNIIVNTLAYPYELIANLFGKSLKQKYRKEIEEEVVFVSTKVKEAFEEFQKKARDEYDKLIRLNREIFEKQEDIKDLKFQSYKREIDLIDEIYGRELRNSLERIKNIRRERDEQINAIKEVDRLRQEREIDQRKKQQAMRKLQEDLKRARFGEDFYRMTLEEFETKLGTREEQLRSEYEVLGTIDFETFQALQRELAIERVAYYKRRLFNEEEPERARVIRELEDLKNKRLALERAKEIAKLSGDVIQEGDIDRQIENISNQLINLNQLASGGTLLKYRQEIQRKLNEATKQYYDAFFDMDLERARASDNERQARIDGLNKQLELEQRNYDTLKKYHDDLISEVNSAYADSSNRWLDGIDKRINKIIKSSELYIDDINRNVLTNLSNTLSTLDSTSNNVLNNSRVMADSLRQYFNGVVDNLDSIKNSVLDITSRINEASKGIITRSNVITGTTGSRALQSEAKRSYSSKMYELASLLKERHGINLDLAAIGKDQDTENMYGLLLNIASDSNKAKLLQAMLDMKIPFDHAIKYVTYDIPFNQSVFARNVYGLDKGVAEKVANSGIKFYDSSRGLIFDFNDVFERINNKFPSDPVILIAVTDVILRRSFKKEGLPGFATGGVIDRPTFATLGENGAEMVLNSRQISNLFNYINSNSFPRGSSNININFEINNPTFRNDSDIKKLVELVSAKISRNISRQL